MRDRARGRSRHGRNEFLASTNFLNSSFFRCGPALNSVNISWSRDPRVRLHLRLNLMRAARTSGAVLAYPEPAVSKCSSTTLSPVAPGQGVLTWARASSSGSFFGAAADVGTVAGVAGGRGGSGLAVAGAAGACWVGAVSLVFAAVCAPRGGSASGAPSSLVGVGAAGGCGASSRSSPSFSRSFFTCRAGSRERGVAGCRSFAESLSRICWTWLQGRVGGCVCALHGIQPHRVVWLNFAYTRASGGWLA